LKIENFTQGRCFIGGADANAVMFSSSSVLVQIVFVIVIQSITIKYFLNDMRKINIKLTSNGNISQSSKSSSRLNTSRTQLHPVKAAWTSRNQNESSQSVCSASTSNLEHCLPSQTINIPTQRDAQHKPESSIPCKVSPSLVQVQFY